MWLLIFLSCSLINASLFSWGDLPSRKPLRLYHFHCNFIPNSVSSNVSSLRLCIRLYGTRIIVCWLMSYPKSPFRVALASSESFPCSVCSWYSEKSFWGSSVITGTFSRFEVSELSPVGEFSVLNTTVSDAIVHCCFSLRYQQTSLLWFLLLQTSQSFPKL